ncbi:hypothetical protein FACS1894176_08210 [Bacteroidia bacterium]|nr:hypothetical protein FACS1894176_08210 [Bacteroidia bacterium]
MEINPQKIDGHWDEGWALDIHTSSSSPIKDESGNIIKWDTKRPPIAEELYQVKYCKKRDRVDNIAKTAADFLKKYKDEWKTDLIIPIPPSDETREFQPVYEIAKTIGKYSAIPVDTEMLKKIKTPPLKEIEDPAERREILKDSFTVQPDSLNGKDVLIFDDLYRSGDTLNAAYDVILNDGKADSATVLTITKTRSKR